MDINWNTVHSIECGGYNNVGSLIADTVKGQKLLDSYIVRYPTIVMCNEVIGCVDDLLNVLVKASSF